MRIFLTIFLIAVTISLVTGQVKVRGYYRKDGTYVRPHYRSYPDGNPYNNWSYLGNTNHYTGKVAFRRPPKYSGNNAQIAKSYNRTYSLYSSDTFNDYYILTKDTDYRGMMNNHNYSTSQGEARYESNGKFNIYDKSNKYIGYVKLNRSRRKFTVFDIDDNKISTSKNNSIKWMLIGGLMTTVIIYSTGLE